MKTMKRMMAVFCLLVTAVTAQVLQVSGLTEIPGAEAANTFYRPTGTNWVALAGDYRLQKVDGYWEVQDVVETVWTRVERSDGKSTKPHTAVWPDNIEVALADPGSIPGGGGVVTPTDPGSIGTPGAVPTPDPYLRTYTQALTDEQKATVLANIGLGDIESARNDMIKVPPLLEKERRTDPNVPTRIVFHGDSLTVLKRYELFDNVVPDRFGSWSGMGLDYVAKVSSSSAFDRTLWPTSEIHSLTSLNDVKINYNTNQDIECDSITVYYLAESGAGTFELQVGPNGGAYATVGSAFDADNGGAPALAVATITVPRGSHTLNVHHASGGAVKIITARFMRSWSAGPELYMIAKGGEEVSDWNDVEDFVMHGILGDIQPHVITSQSADPVSELEDLQSTIIDPWSGYASGADAPHWLLISRNTWGDNNLTFLAEQKAQADFLRDLARSQNHSFIDMAIPFGMSPQAGGLTTTGNDVHPSDPVGLFLDWSYIFGKLSYFTAGPLRSSNSSLDDEDGVVTAKLFNEGLALNLANYVTPPWYNEGNVTSGGTRSLDALTIPGSAVVGASANMTLAKRVMSGTGTGQGSRFFSDYGYFIAVNGIFRDANTKLRLLLAASPTSTDLTREGFGLEITSTGARIITHDEVSKSTSADSLGVFNHTTDQMNYMVWIRDGIAYAARLNSTGGIIERIEHSGTMPETFNAGAATYNNVVLAAVQETSTSASGLTSEFNIFKSVLINNANF